MSRIRALIREIHRRSLWQVLGIYGVASWAVFEVVQTLTEGLGLPGWFPSFAFLLLLIGLPVVLATAFVQEGGPGSEGPADAPSEVAMLQGEPHPLETGEARASGSGAEGGAEEGGLHDLLTWRNALTGGVLAFALWGVIAAGWLVFGGGPPSAVGEPGPLRASVAVLPFENLSGDPEARPFTDGVHDDLLTQLAKVESLKVISRTSVMEYRESTKSVGEIAAELGVAAILEGGVQRAGNRIRVNAQLIDARSDEHLWAETYDERLTVENVFEIQSALARRIAAALETELTPEEAGRIADRPTDDLGAYDYFVRGQAYRFRSYDHEDMELAIGMFERAVGEDPAFGEAWAALSEAHSFQYLLGNDRTPGRLEAAKEAVDRALTLEPEDPVARLALGLYHYRGFQDYDRALTEYERASADLPGDAFLHSAMAGAYRRAGSWERALRHFRRAAELDPRSAQAHYELGATYYLMRRYREALEHLERTVALAPDWGNPYGLVAAALLSVGSEPDSALAVVAGAPIADELFFVRIWLRRMTGDLEEALEIARGSAPDLSENQWQIRPRPDLLGSLEHDLGRAEEARLHLDSARVLLEKRLEETPRDPRAHGSLGEVLARLGRREEAVRHGRRAVELYPVERDALEGPSFLMTLARIHALLGERDEAIAALQRAFRIPGRLSPGELLHDPDWASLRGDPRFRTLLEPWTR